MLAIDRFCRKLKTFAWDWFCLLTRTDKDCAGYPSQEIPESIFLSSRCYLIMQHIPLCIFLLIISWNVPAVFPLTDNYKSLKVEARGFIRNEAIHSIAMQDLFAFQDVSHQSSMNLFIDIAWIYLTFDWSAFFVCWAHNFSSSVLDMNACVISCT